MLEQILQWPPIGQSIIGSTIFAVVLWVLKTLYSFGFSKVAKFNREFYRSRINAELVHCTAMNSENVNIQSFSLIGLIYVAFIDVLKALICVCLGMILASILPILKEVSIVFAMYFLMNALNVVNRSSKKSKLTYNERIEALKQELAELEDEK
ncbi:hypothetical protein [Vibrio genomosp. F10]|uniref:hypothetical protein n=1 Tax=Vibrio genomosp. F10 TaxID=723171 RepID=UPI00114D27E9|nr:hypothetical protein [Vibrio genomosp. F10]